MPLPPDKVEDVMTSEVQKVEACLKVLPVVNGDGRLVGVVDREDLLSHFRRE